MTAPGREVLPMVPACRELGSLALSVCRSGSGFACGLARRLSGSGFACGLAGRLSGSGFACGLAGAPVGFRACHGLGSLALPWACRVPGLPWAWVTCFAVGLSRFRLAGELDHHPAPLVAQGVGSFRLGRMEPRQIMKPCPWFRACRGLGRWPCLCACRVPVCP